MDACLDCEFTECISVAGCAVECFRMRNGFSRGTALFQRDFATETRWYLVECLAETDWRRMENYFEATVCMYRSPDGFSSSQHSSPCVLRQARRLSTIAGLPVPRHKSYVPPPLNPLLTNGLGKLSQAERNAAAIQNVSVESAACSFENLKKKRSFADWATSAV